MIQQANLGQSSNVLEMKSKPPLNHLKLDNFKRLNIIETLFIINYFILFDLSPGLVIFLIF